MNPSKSNSRTKSIAFIGLAVALIAVSAWITVPLGPVPFTLQMLSITFVVCLLKPKEAIAAIYCYELLGAIGVPVFSGMRGGIGVLMGPTGGFLLGYLIGVPVAVGFLYLVRKAIDSNRSIKAQQSEDGSDASFAGTQGFALKNIKGAVSGICAGVIFTLIAYTFGVVQYMAVSGVGIEVALTVSVIPFIIPDIAKIVIAAICAQSVAAALGLGKNVEYSADRA